MVDHRVEWSRLAFLTPDGTFCTEGEVEYQSPKWLVSGTTEGKFAYHTVTVINAMTGEVRCSYCPC